MSVFVFGYFEPKANVAPAAIASAATAVAARKGLYCLLGPNVHQHIITDMLANVLRAPVRGLPFVLTRCANDDTSHSLFESDATGDAYASSVKSSLLELMGWFASVLGQCHPARAAIAITTGYEEEFEYILHPDGTNDLSTLVDGIDCREVPSILVSV